jgi:hypothetical protein
VPSTQQNGPYSGVLGTFTLCSESVSVIGHINASGAVAYLGQGTGGSDDLIDGFNTALDPVGRVLYALAIYQGARETVTLFGLSVDTGG